MTEKYSKQLAVDAPPDSSTRIIMIPEIRDLTSTYFVALRLTDSAGKSLSSNFYWLSTKPDLVDEARTKDTAYTPTGSYADFTALGTLPSVVLNAGVRFEQKGKSQFARVALHNPSRDLAFFVRLRVTRGQEGEEILPVLWQDNYIPLLPGEKREVSAEYGVDQLRGARPAVRIDGWNVPPKIVNP